MSRGVPGRAPGGAWYALPMDHDVAGMRRHYKTNGFVTGVPVLPPGEAAALLSRVEALERDQAAAAGGAWVERGSQPHSPTRHPQEDLLGPLVRDPRVLAPVTALLGPDVLLRNCDVFVKTGETDVRIGWHTDTGRIGRSTDGMLSLWLALTPATVDNGAMRFVAGSHVHAEPPPPRDNRHLSLSEDAVARLDLSRVVDNPLSPGLASLHHFGLVHCSGANGSGARRVAIVMRFMAPWVSRFGAECGRATLVSGRDRYGKYRLEDRFPVTWTLR